MVRTAARAAPMATRAGWCLPLVMTSGVTVASQSGAIDFSAGSSASAILAVVARGGGAFVDVLTKFVWLMGHNLKSCHSNDCGEMQIVLRLFESRAKVSYWAAILFKIVS